MTIQNRYINVGGHRHRYVDTGGHGPTMLLLHGISSSLDFYRLSIPLLAGSFRVLALDLLGFGESDKPKNKPYSLNLYAGLIHEFLEKTDAAGNGPVYGTGHSMGGKYLLATALTYPGTFDKIVLSNTDGFITLPSFARVLSLPGVRHLLKKVVTREEIAKKMFASAFHNIGAIDAVTRRKILDVAVDHDAFDTVMGLNRNLLNLDMKRTGLRSRLKELTMPVLIIWGDRDRYMSPKYAHIVKKELPCAKLLIFSECGHSPMLEYPAQFCEAITEFIHQESPPSDGICS
ncbi:MAG: alpha/beta hydrolase [Chlorobiaceae bacterium]|nr:alpha/beta hydrolase [Chlorobiaceae bacterium]